MSKILAVLKQTPMSQLILNFRMLSYLSMCYKYSSICILLLIFLTHNALTNSYTNDIISKTGRDPLESASGAMINDSNIVADDNSNAFESQFTETYLDLLGNLELNRLSDRSIKNDTKIATTEATLQDLKKILETHLKKIKGFEKRDTKLHEKKKAKFLHKPSQRSVSTSSRASTVWEEWTPWSSCSVSCGKGRHIRWRHCRESCIEAETEMEEKACQMPACPQKLFGLINL